MATRYVGAGVAAEILEYSPRHVWLLRKKGHFPPPDVEVEEASGRVRPGWHRATITAFKAGQVLAPREHSTPPRYMAMSAIARRYGFSTWRGYEREEENRRKKKDEFPPHAVELEEPDGGLHKGWDPAVVEAYEPRLNRTPGRPQRQPRT